MASPLARLESEQGFSLVEVLVTIVIVTVTFVAILGGMMVSMTTSDLHRKQATADALVRDAAEALKNTSVSYVPCATSSTSSYVSALPTSPSGYSVTLSAPIMVWDGTLTASGEPQFRSSGGGCTDRGLQQVTVRASAAGGVSETIQFIKRQT
jgi:prepilin-type N-terminal cleavage/methylation domain-containing protein